MKTQRARLLDIITENVRYLVKLRSDASFRKLEHVMEATGFFSNRSHQSWKSLGDTIIALAGITDREHLAMTAHAAVFYRLFNRNRPGGDWQHADQMADDELRAAGFDVDAWNAKHERQEERIHREGRRLLAKHRAPSARAVVN